MTTTRTYRVGEKVTPDPDDDRVPPVTLGRVFTVAKVNPRNLRCTADDGGKGINFPPDILLPATPENVGKATAPRPFVPIEFFDVGEIVTFKRPPTDRTETTPYVVTKDNGEKVNVTLLGGEGTRYFRANRANLVKRDLTWLAEALVEAATAA